MQMLKKAKGFGIPIIKESFIQDSIKKGELENFEDHNLENPKKKKKSEKIQNFLLPDDIFSLVITFLAPFDLFTASLVCKKWLEYCQFAEIDFDTEDEIFQVMAKNPNDHKSFLDSFAKRFPNRIVRINGVDVTNDIIPNLSSLKEYVGASVDDGEITFTLLAKHCKNLEKIEFLNTFESSPDEVFQECKKLKEIKFSSDEGDIDIDSITDTSLEILANNNSGSLEVFDVNALCEKVTEKGLTILIEKCTNLRTLLLVYNYTHEEGWENESPFTKKFFEKLLSLPKLGTVVLNAKLKKYVSKKLKNYKKIQWAREEEEEDE